MILRQNNHITQTLLAVSLMVVTDGTLTAQASLDTQLAEK